jgi:glutathionylspermidine synthase
MQRIFTSPRPNWENKVEEQGLTFHTPGGNTYWDESAYYKFNSKQIDELEAAANELHMMCIFAAENVIENERWAQLGIPGHAIPFILRSWERDDFSLYGRFDFSYDGINPPIMLEYNADTPTSLVEAAVCQWYWQEEKFPDSDQFNSIHEKLIEGWRAYHQRVGDGTIYLGGVKDHDEDYRTVEYIRDTCHQAGFETKQLYVEDIGWANDIRAFVDLNNNRVDHYFKLYPWEGLFHEEHFNHIKDEDKLNFIEPGWKALLSNKGILPILWEMFPNHKNLVPAFFENKFSAANSYVKKPLLSREGANINIFDGYSGEIAKSEGEYGEEGYIYQQLKKLPNYSGNHPVCGVWMINHEAAGLGIREDKSLITGNLSRFVPHIFE